MPYFTSIWPVEVVNNYAKLVVLLATGAFFIVVSYANQWIKDELFLELKEEQERHFQSYRNLVGISSIFIRSYTVMECLRWSYLRRLIPFWLLVKRETLRTYLMKRFPSARLCQIFLTCFLNCYVPSLRVSIWSFMLLELIYHGGSRPYIPIQY